MTHSFLRKSLFALAFLAALIPAGSAFAAEAELERICSSGTLQDLKRALEHVSADVVFPSGNRPLHVVAEYASDPAMVELLVEKGASLSAEGLEKLTPIMLAAAYNPHPKLIEALLKAGAPVNSADGQGRTPLYLAAASNEAPEVTAELLRKGAQPNIRDKNGRSPLWVASKRASEQIVQLLLDSGARVDEPNDEGLTPLLVASEKPESGVLRLLIEAGANANVRDKNRYTPLMSAVAAGADVNAINALLEGKADPNAEDDQNRSAILLAASRPGTSPEVLNALIKGGANCEAMDSFLTTPLMEACKQKNSAAVACLLKAGAKVELRDRNSWTALLHAASKGAPQEIYQLLIEAGADINETTRRGVSALMVAVESKVGPEALQVLLNLGANPDRQALDTVSVLMGAIAANDIGSVKTLLAGHADPNLGTWDGLTPLMLAAQRIRTPEIFELLTRAGASPDRKNAEGMTALMVAAGVGNDEAMESLVALSADLEARDLDGATPLFHAVLAREENLSGIDILLKAGSNVNAKDAGGMTPLMHAAFRGRTDTVKRLLEAGADTSATDTVGWTPMHFAARSSEGLGSVRLLIENKCSPDIPDRGGTTPIMVAASYNNSDALQALIDAGANYTRQDNTGRNAYEYALLKNATDAVRIIENAKEEQRKK